MGIDRGTDWGTFGEVPKNAICVPDDESAHHLVRDAKRSGDPLPQLCLTGGDLARCLGGGRSEAHLRGEGATHVRIDLGAVLIDGRLDWFMSHLVAKRSWLRGRVVVVANTDFLGRWNIAPRAHPGDGRLNLIDSDLPISDRLKAWRRLPAGAHVPHPGITMRSSAAFQLEFPRPTPVRLDGVRAGSARRLSIRTEPDSLDVWI